MSIINPSRKFEGGEMSDNPYGAVIRPGIRTINFRDQENKNGVYLFLLPAYKVDSHGAGVWYKLLTIRDNFGLGTKEKFAVQSNCPADWFAAKAKLYVPKYAEVTKEEKDGRTLTIYPAFGRTTKRVLFNAAYFKQLALGAHVLDLPQFGAADVIEAWCRTKQPDGSDNPMLNDYNAAIPIEFKLDKNVKGNPWKVTINSGKAYKLNEALADSDNLYNLEDVVLYPSKQEVIDKLRKLAPVEIFDKCMNGYTDAAEGINFGGKAIVQGFTAPAALPSNPDDGDLGPAIVKAQVLSNPTVAPAFNIPKASIPTASAVASTKQADPVANVPRTTTSVSANPVAGVSVEEALQFLQQK